MSEFERLVPVTMLWNGKASWYAFDYEVRRADSLDELLRCDAFYQRVKLEGGKWITINGARVYIKRGYIVAGGGGMIPGNKANPTGANILRRQMWKSYQCMIDHQKHASDYGDSYEYKRRGLELVQKACNDHIKGYARKDGITIVRYDENTNDFAIGVVGDRGGLITLYKPKRGKDYFLEQMKFDLADGGTLE